MVTSKDISLASAPGLVSLVIPCCGMLEYTKLCVASVLQFSREPFEMIFLDIGSLDGTAEFLAGVQIALKSRLRVEIVRTPTDLGIKDVCKEALQNCRGDFTCLLNNDTVVTAGWLNAMTALVSMSAGHGMVGPMSNYAAVPQLVETVPYRTASRAGQRELVDVAAIHAFANEFREKHKGKWLETERLGGFCLLLKRAVLDRATGLDEFTDLSLFDTDILSSKARQAGFNLCVCRDLFIHHFGTRTFAHGAPKDAKPDRVGLL